MAPSQSKFNELQKTFLCPSTLIKLDRNIKSQLIELKDSTSLKKQKKLALDLWLNLLHKEASLKAIDFSHKIKFIQQQPISFLVNCYGLWGIDFIKAKENAEKALNILSCNLEAIEGGGGQDTFGAYNDGIQNVQGLLREILEILEDFNADRVFAEASFDLLGRPFDPTMDRQTMSQELLDLEENFDPEIDPVDCDELPAEVERSRDSIDEQKKIASDLWFELLYQESLSDNESFKIDITDQENFVIKCKDIGDNLVDSAKFKVIRLLSDLEECSVDTKKQSHYRRETANRLREASRKFQKLIKIFDALDIKEVFTGALRTL